MKLFSKIFVAVALFAATAPNVKAQNPYAVSSAAGSLIAYPMTNATTVITNLNLDVFRLSARAGADTLLAWEGKSITGTNTTQTNRVIVTLATAIKDPTTGPWLTNTFLTWDTTTGTNLATPYTQGTTNLGAVRFIKVVGCTVNGTNLGPLIVGSTTNAGSYVWFDFGQHRP